MRTSSNMEDRENEDIKDNILVGENEIENTY